MIEFLIGEKNQPSIVQNSNNIWTISGVDKNIDIKSASIVYDLGVSLSFDPSRVTVLMVQSDVREDVDVVMSPSVRVLEPNKQLQAKFKAKFDRACRSYEVGESVVQLIAIPIGGVSNV
jgi:hypothetical protein